MVNRIGVVLLIVLAHCIVLLVILHYYHHTSQQTQPRNNIPLNNIASLQLENRGKSESLNVESPGFVPVEDRIVPSHASYSNKFNDQIGTLNADVVGYGTQEVVIPSDWYMKVTPPTEFDGPYWPSGRIQPEFPAAQPDWYRPKRSQYASAGYHSVRGT